MSKILKKLKGMKLQDYDIHLAVVSYFYRNRKHVYSVKYIEMEKKLRTKMAKILEAVIDSTTSVSEYDPEVLEPEMGQALFIASSETEFEGIFDKIIQSDPEKDKISSVDELGKARGYMIVISDSKRIHLIGYKKIPESWKLKSSKGIFNVIFEERKCKDLESI
ncbi:hypothetical protein, partial [Leptospira sp. id769339]|uniref:hypothetical protein n=1 Tax=Leptospira sp. id769339 TaxID=2864221 RepID=UPI00214C30AD